MLIFLSLGLNLIKKDLFTFKLLPFIFHHLTYHKGSHLCDLCLWNHIHDIATP